MAMFRWALCLVVLTAGEFFIVSSQEIEKADIGSWHVGDCILAEFAMNFTVSNLPKLYFGSVLYITKWSPPNNSGYTWFWSNRICDFLQIFETSAEDKGNATQITLPDTATPKPDKNGTQCSKDVLKEQILELSWREKQKNDTSINLTRFIRIYYKRMPNAS